MSETRRATVMLIQRGDPEISGALMAGVIAGRAEVDRVIWQINQNHARRMAEGQDPQTPAD